MSGAATATRRKAGALATSAAPVGSWWVVPAELARVKLDSLFETCYFLDVPSPDEQDLLHLVSAARCAFNHGLTEALDASTADPIDEIMRTCCEGAAVLRAALAQPHGSMGMQWPSFVHHAIRVLNALGDLMMNGPEHQADLDAAISGAAPSPSGGQTWSRAPATDPLHSHKPEHVAMVLDQISLCAETIRDVADVEDSGNEKAQRLSRRFIWSQAIMIGALADQMTGFSRIGTLASWVTGDNVDTHLATEGAAS